MENIDNNVLNIYPNLEKINNNLTKMADNLNIKTNTALSSAKDGTLRTEQIEQLRGDNIKLISSTQLEINKLLITNNQLQQQATAAKYGEYERGNEANKYLNVLSDYTEDNINKATEIQHNRKRIIEIQKNRIYKNKFIQETLIYILFVIILVCILFFINKITNKSFNNMINGVIILTTSIFIIYLIIRYINYNRRWDYNLKRINIGPAGGGYKKSVYTYDTEEIDTLKSNF